MDEITRLENLHGAEINQAKITLATEATALCHGRQAAEAAFRSAQGLYASTKSREGTQPPGSVEAAGLIPSYKIDRADLTRGIPAFEFFVLAKFSPSKAEARRLIRGGGARINGEIISNEMQIVDGQSLADDGRIRISAGKKRHAHIYVQP